MDAALEPLLGILPAILLVVLLVCGRYPGERIIVRFAARRSRSARRRAGSIAHCHPREAGIREALLLLAASRPLRGPPLASMSRL
jgi:hypothetical protein